MRDNEFTPTRAPETLSTCATPGAMDAHPPFGVAMVRMGVDQMSPVIALQVIE
ncbi:hypothetical protein [Glutamicibacter creatinolyticus]|uniref:hypothetical protein n=1 Tax=Glutamicibacter creatinolyticus TaxID=162496 RepID=UPI0031E39D64